MTFRPRLKPSFALIPALLLAFIAVLLNQSAVAQLSQTNGFIGFERGTSGRLNTGGTTRQVPFDVSGSNTLLIVGWAHDGGSSVTSVTYDGISMTSLADQTVAGTGFRTGMFYLLSPTAGTHDLALIRNTSGATMVYTVALYTGVKQSGQPDAVTSGTVGGTSTPSASITTVADNCWIIGSTFSSRVNSFSTVSAGTNTYLREQSPDQNNLFDSNAAVPAGSNFVSWTLTASENTGWVFASFAPALRLAFLTQPKDETVLVGSNATLAAIAAGQRPFFFQWFFNSTNLLTAQTNATITFSKVDLSQAGTYSVNVSNSLGSITSSNAILTVLDTADTDHDGIPNYWEQQHGLNPANAFDGTTYPTAENLPNRLTYLQKYLYGLNPTTPDSDGDGLSDFDELFIYGTNPLKRDTDGDGMPDGWEVANGLNPRVNDASGDLDLDGLTNLQEYNLWLTNPFQRPDRMDSLGDGGSDYERLTGGQTNRFYYDRNDRLVGAEYSRGISIAYIYDGNDNLIRQRVLSRASETNGLPVLWRFLNGLTNNSSAFADTDGDGWTDYQEWKAGTNPRDAASKPGLNGNSGLNLASLQLPFTPSNFVVGVGQLDGLGAEEIVLGADGNPGTNVNFLLVLTQGTSAWSTQRVEVGPFGITSIAVGQLTNRPSAGIYVGLRGTANGSGRVMEFTRNAGFWQSNVVAFSTNEAAFVLGVSGREVLVSLATTNAPDGSLSAGSFTTNWSLSSTHTNTSHRGLGILFQPQPQTISAAPLRLLDSGSVAVGAAQFSALASKLVSYWKLDEASGNAVDSVGSNTLTNIGAATYSAGLINNGANLGNDGSYRKLAKADNLGLTIDGARTFSCWVRMNTELGSGETWFLVNRNVASPTANNEFELAYDYNGGARRLYFQKTDNNTHVAANRIGYPISLGTSVWHHLVGTTDGSTLTFYVDGVSRGTASDFASNGNNTFGSSTFELGQTDRPTQFNVDEVAVWSRALSPEEVNLLFGNGHGLQYSAPGVLLPEPEAIRTNTWRGSSLASGSLRGTNGSSVFYNFIDDKNANGLTDYADDFVTAEYLVVGTNASLLTLSRQPIVSLTAAQSYGLASVNFLGTSNDVLFTGEPDGQVFAWTATGATNPLQRQLFSLDHAGKAWHALAAVKTLESGEGLIGLRVDPAAPQRCDVFLWPPKSQFLQQASFPQTAPIAAILPSATPLGNLPTLTNRLWDSEGNASTPYLQFQFVGATNWQDATIVALDGVPYTLGTRVAALPGGVNHILVWDAATDLGPGKSTNILLRARAADMTSVGAWSVGTPFHVETSFNPDSDNDGLPDAWEIFRFGNLSQRGTDDPDGDGYNNFAEYLAGTDPNLAASNPSLSIRLEGGQIRLEWTAQPVLPYYLERRTNLFPSSLWEIRQTNPPSGILLPVEPGAAYFRLRIGN